MPPITSETAILRVADLRPNGVHRFDLAPDAAHRADLAAVMGIVAVRKLRLHGELRPEGKGGWRLAARLGATVVQSCIVTLDPVTTRIDLDVTRHFLPHDALPEITAGSETEMPEDDSIDPLGDRIDLGALMAEELALALPTYPRKDGVELGDAAFARPGVAPLRDEDLKPFAGLGALRDKLGLGAGEDGQSDAPAPRQEPGQDPDKSK